MNLEQIDISLGIRSIMKSCLAWKAMAKTQNHECKGTKGYTCPEKNGEEGPFTVGKPCTNLYCCL